MDAPTLCLGKNAETFNTLYYIYGLCKETTVAEKGVKSLDQDSLGQFMHIGNPGRSTSNCFLME
jgi:hypothetical protein